MVVFMNVFVVVLVVVFMVVFVEDVILFYLFALQTHSFDPKPQ